MMKSNSVYVVLASLMFSPISVVAATQLDTLTTVTLQVTPSEKASIERSRELRPMVDEFVHLMYVEHKGRDAFNKYVAENLVEHDPDSLDGRDSIFKFMKKRFEGPNTEHYLPMDQWKVYVDEVVVHGDLAIIRTHAFQRENDKGRVFFNFWRWKGDKIVEHWDVIQNVPANKTNPRDMW